MSVKDTAESEILDRLDDQISIKMEPELRHVLAHFYYALECLIHGRKIGAMDNIKCVEGLIMFDGSEDDWENYYQSRFKAEAEKLLREARDGEVQKAPEKEDKLQVQGEKMQGEEV